VTVLGVGVDVVSVARMARALERGRFCERVFTPEERQVARRPHPAEAFAVRFAAKEAALKALGLGLTLRRLQQVGVVREPGAPPRLVLEGDLLARFTALGGERIHVSLSHERAFAVAVVVVEG
jgi:holo-[acyl-carrier protein] synthase